MQDDDVPGELPDDTSAMLEELFASMKRAPLLTESQRPRESSPSAEELLMRPDVLAGMSQDPRYAGDVAQLRSQAEHGFTALLNDSLQWVPVGVSKAVSGNLAMGSAMEVRDLMAASRRNLAGSGSNHDERRLMAQYLAVAGVHNFHDIGWDPSNPATYAAQGSNLLSALLSPPTA